MSARRLPARIAAGAAGVAGAAFVVATVAEGITKQATEEPVMASAFVMPGRRWW
jgi:hypothetical protein